MNKISHKKKYYNSITPSNLPKVLNTKTKIKIKKKSQKKINEIPNIQKYKNCEIITLKDVKPDKLKLFKDFIAKTIKLNPKLVIQPINLPNGNKINVVQDGTLITGTKTRVAPYLLKKIIEKNPEIKTFTYCGSYNGFGAVATAFAAKFNGYKSELFLSRIPTSSNPVEKTNEEILNSRQVITSLALNAKIYLCDSYKDARNLQYSLTTKEVLGKNKWEFINGYYNLDMGLLDQKGEMVNILSEKIKYASEGTVLENIKKPRIWLVIGSSGVARSLKKAFPNCVLYGLLVGGGKYYKNALEWCKKTKDVIVLNDNEKYTIDKLNKLSNKNIEEERIKYYDSTSGYDDQIWLYVKKYGKEGDFIWNVASDNYPVIKKI